MNAKQKLESIIESKVRKIIKENESRPYDKISENDFYQGNYETVEEYKNLIAKGIMVSARFGADAIFKVDTSKNTPLSKLINKLYKEQKDTVDALDDVHAILKSMNIMR